jgi:hypothetical protein
MFRELTNDIKTIHQIPLTRKILAISGTILVVSTIAFVILCSAQTSGFAYKFGTIFSAHSWQLWTLSMPCFVAGIMLISFAFFGKRNQKKENQNGLEKNVASLIKNDKDFKKNDLEETISVSKHFFTHLSLRDYYIGLNLLLGCDEPDFRGIVKGAECIIKETFDFIIDARYADMDNVVVFNENGIVNKKKINEPIAFAYSLSLVLDEDFNYENLKKILQAYAQATLQNRIPKIFIPTSAHPKMGIPHALLLIVEIEPQSQTRISIVNSFGQGGYQTFVNKLTEVAQEIFPFSTIVQNSVCQQQDGWTCALHMLENIDMLTQIENVQDFIRAKKLPQRSSEELREIFYKTYKPYATEGVKRYRDAHVSVKAHQSMLAQLKAEGLIT